VGAQGAPEDCRCVPVDAQGDQWDCGTVNAQRAQGVCRYVPANAQGDKVVWFGVGGLYCLWRWCRSPARLCGVCTLHPVATPPEEELKTQTRASFSARGAGKEPTR